MKIEMFGKKREITLKDCLSFIGKLLLLYGIVKFQVYLDDQENAEGIANMQAAIPAIVSMDGTESLPEKMNMISKTSGVYYGWYCHINETASEKEIVTHYKREFPNISIFNVRPLLPTGDDRAWLCYGYSSSILR